MKRLLLYILLCFSVHLSAQSPGGISTGLYTWYKANGGTPSTSDNSIVYNWYDQSPNANDSWRTGSPVLKDNATDNINFNPAISFPGNGSYFNLNLPNIRSASAQWGGPINDYSIIGVGVREDGGHNVILGDQNSNGANNTFVFGYKNSNTVASLTHWTNDLDVTGLDAYNSPGLSPFLLMGKYDQSSGREIEELRNNSFHRNVDGNTSFLGGYSGFRIGHTAAGGYGDFNGRISEVIIYQSSITPIQKQQIYSYLGIKYGLSLPADADGDGTSNETISGSVKEGDYVASDGSTVIWNFTGQGSTYANHIAGIGRDDNSGLHQKQSKPSDGEGLLTIGLGDIASTNTANSNTFSSDKSFFLWGNNDGPVSFTYTGAPSGREILGRQWRVQETGTVGTVKIQVPAHSGAASPKLPDIGTLDLLVDADGDFTNGAITHKMTLTGDYWEIFINLSDGDYLSFSPSGAEISTTVNGAENGTVSIEFTVLLPSVNNTGSPFTFDITDAGTGSATSGLDYVAIAAGAKVSIPNGSQSATFTVAVLDDALPESVESLDVIIGNPSGPEFFIGIAEASALILDDDAGPGGVGSELNIWLRADFGTSTTTNNTVLNTWSDQSPNGNNGNQDGAPPLFKNNTSENVNYNPVIKFDGTDDRLTIDLEDIKSGRGNGNGKYSIFTVALRDDNDRNYVIGSMNGTYQEKFFFGYENGTTAQMSSGPDVAMSSLNAYNTPALSPFLLYGELNTSGRILEHTRDGSYGRSTDSYTTAIQGSSPNFIGDIQTYSAHFNGRISEIIVYDNVISLLNKQKVYSYLGLKYGLTLTNNNDNDATTNEIISGSVREGDYISSDGTIIWDYALQGSTYFNDIAGVGRDDASNLRQKQSKSGNPDALLRIGLDTITSTNLQNTSTFPFDNSFLMWGSNNGSVSFTTTDAPPNREILDRKWKVQETGSVGSVLLRFPAFSSSEPMKLPDSPIADLLIDDDADFSSGATAIPMTLIDNNWQVKLDLEDGQYFTVSRKGVEFKTVQNGSESGPVDIVFSAVLPYINTTGSPITFDLDDASSGSATSGNDYIAIPPSAQISVANGSDSGSYSISVIDDEDIEGVETLDVTFSNPSSTEFIILGGTASITATISDNDAKAPGGVIDNLAFWLKADTGINTMIDGADVSNWNDQTANGNDAYNISTAPIFRETASNYNPAIDFSGTLAPLEIANSNDINIGNSSARSYSIIFRTGNDITTRQLIYEQGGGTRGLNLYLLNGNLHANMWFSNDDNAASVAIASNTTYLFTFIYDGPSGRWDGFLNGSPAMNDISVPSSLNSHSGKIGIGAINNDTQYDGGIDVSSGDGFSGQVMEMAYYNEKVLTAAERTKIESYFGIKYGISLPGNYIASDGNTIIWDYDDNAGFNYNISIIGVDESSLLQQKQSRSSGENSLLSIGLSPLAENNRGNQGSIAYNSFLAWGHNAGSLSGESSNVSIPSESGIIDKLKRIWKVVETGSVDTIEVVVSKAAIDSSLPFSSYGFLHLRTADDSSFISNIVDIPLSVSTFNGDSVYSCKADFQSTRYFTFIQKGFIIWTGSEWRGGLSSDHPHQPSEAIEENSKTLHILSGDTAHLSGCARVMNTEIYPSARFILDPGASLTTSSIDNSGDLILKAGNNEFAQYKGPATEGRFQQYIDNDGWHLIGSPFSDATFTDFSFLNDNGFINHPIGGNSLDSCNYCHLWWYDASTDNGENIGFGASTAYGTWRSSANENESFVPTKGWNFNFDGQSNFASPPFTIDVEGTFNSGTITQIVNENNGGWNLVANPYPSVIDWNKIDDDLSGQGIAPACYIWDEENSNYAVYANGTGTLSATRYIAPFQGFYIQTAQAGGQNSGDVLHNFNLDNSDRPDLCKNDSSVFFKTNHSKEKITLRATYENKADETVITFDRTSSRDPENTQSVNKLFPPTGSNTVSIYHRADNRYNAISSLPIPPYKDSIPIGILSKNGHLIKLEVSARPHSWNIYIEDLKTGIWYSAGEAFEFVQDSRLTERFILHYSQYPITPKSPEGNALEAYFRGMELIIKIRSDIFMANWQLTSVSGQTVKAGNIKPGSGQLHTVNMGHIKPGVYILALETEGKLYTQKIPFIY